MLIWAGTSSGPKRVTTHFSNYASSHYEKCIEDLMLECSFNVKSGSKIEAPDILARSNDVAGTARTGNSSSYTTTKRSVVIMKWLIRPLKPMINQIFGDLRGRPGVAMNPLKFANKDARHPKQSNMAPYCKKKFLHLFNFDLSNDSRTSPEGLIYAKFILQSLVKQCSCTGMDMTVPSTCSDKAVEMAVASHQPFDKILATSWAL
ncbi:hypothetical protein DFH06DRAFT_1123752 [Mycena polygramma]|nr:hypothetical protein DFH06DRAFT_1123752 [Mycena polygramma]